MNEIHLLQFIELFRAMSSRDIQKKVSIGTLRKVKGDQSSQTVEKVAQRFNQVTTVSILRPSLYELLCSTVEGVQYSRRISSVLLRDTISTLESAQYCGEKPNVFALIPSQCLWFSYTELDILHITTQMFPRLILKNNFDLFFSEINENNLSTVKTPKW